MTEQRKRIEIYDTTLRDGTQSEGVSLSLQDRLLIVEALDTLGVDYIEGGYPLSNPKDAEFFEALRKVTLVNAKLAAFGMTRRKGVKASDDVGMAALLAAETPVVTLVGKAGTLVMVSVASMAQIETQLSLFDLTMFNKRIQGTIFGSSNPQAEIPQLLDLYQQGKLKVDELVTKTYSLDQINEGYQAMRDGKNIRGVITFD